MPFFENLGAALSSTGRDVAKKARDSLETSRLNGLIAQEEARVQTLYARIGRQYYERRQGEPEEGYAETFAQLKQVFDAIEGLRVQLRQLRGFTKCPACGADIPVGSAFCPGCGAAAPKPASVPAAVCARCGRPLAPDALFCAGCGYPVAQHQAMPPAPAACRACGAPLPDGARFCRSCGAPQQGETPVPPAAEPPAQEETPAPDSHPDTDKQDEPASPAPENGEEPT